MSSFTYRPSAIKPKLLICRRRHQAVGDLAGPLPDKSKLLMEDFFCPKGYMAEPVIGRKRTNASTIENSQNAVNVTLQETAKKAGQLSEHQLKSLYFTFAAVKMKKAYSVLQTLSYAWPPEVRPSSVKNRPRSNSCCKPKYRISKNVWYRARLKAELR